MAPPLRRCRNATLFAHTLDIHHHHHHPPPSKTPQNSIASTAAPAAAAATTAEGLQVPHGGALVNLMAPADQRAALVASCTKTMELSDRNACDVELLCVG